MLVVNSQFQCFGLFMHSRTKLLLSLGSSSSVALRLRRLLSLFVVGQHRELDTADIWNHLLTDTQSGRGFAGQEDSESVCNKIENEEVRYNKVAEDAMR